MRSHSVEPYRTSNFRKPTAFELFNLYMEALSFQFEEGRTSNQKVVDSGPGLCGFGLRGKKYFLHPFG